MDLNPDPDALSERPKDCSKVIHAGAAIFRQPAVQALAWFGCRGGQCLKTDCRIHEVAQNQARRTWFPIEKQACGLVKKRLGEGRIAFDALDDGMF